MIGVAGEARSSRSPVYSFLLDGVNITTLRDSSLAHPLSLRCGMAINHPSSNFSDQDQPKLDKTFRIKTPCSWKCKLDDVAIEGSSPLAV